MLYALLNPTGYNLPLEKLKRFRQWGSVLPPEIRGRASIEAATPKGWRQLVGYQGVAIGIPHFGASAPAGMLYQELGLTAQRMAEETRRLVMRSKV